MGDFLDIFKHDRAGREVWERFLKFQELLNRCADKPGNMPIEFFRTNKQVAADLTVAAEIHDNTTTRNP